MDMGKVKVLDICYSKENQDLKSCDLRLIYERDDVITNMVSYGWLVFYNKKRAIAIHDSDKYFELKIIINEDDIK